MANTIPADYVFPPGLPADVCTRLREADSTSIAAVVDAAFAELAFPEHLILLPAERLTPAQRALAQTLAACRIHTKSSCGYGRRYAVPEGEDLAQWLGLEPPDALSETVSFELHGVVQSEPLWRAVLLLQAEDHAAKAKHKEAFIQALPLAKRWELWGLCNLRFPRPWGLEDHVFFPLDFYAEAHQHLVDGSAHAWAARFLDALLAKQNRSLGRSTLLPFLMLARANAPIEPRWFALLPTAGRFDLVDEIIFSIPIAQRGAAVQQWFDRMLFPNDVVKAAIRILPRMPDPAVVARALEAIPKAMGSALLHRRALRTASGTHAELLALIDAADAAAGPPMVLTLLAVRTPTTVAELTEEDQAQLLVAGKRYHGKATSLVVLMSRDNEETSLNHDLTVLSIGDAKGKPLYDGWLYMTDAGCFFTKGKTRVVAERAQFAIESKNEKLSEALETLLRQPLEPSKVPTKKPAKAKPSKR